MPLNFDDEQWRGFENESDDTALLRLPSQLDSPTVSRSKQKDPVLFTLRFAQKAGRSQTVEVGQATRPVPGRHSESLRVEIRGVGWSGQ